jgi:hypothetical protein
MPKMSKLPRMGNCAYCGDYGVLTRDHVIPRNLFSKPLPGDIPIVYACEKCNLFLKSVYDTDLRDLLLIDKDSSQSSRAQLLYPKFERAVTGNRSKMARTMQEDSYPVRLNLQPGVIAYIGNTSPEANRQMPKILEMIVRGLYHHHTNRILPPYVAFSGMRELNYYKLEEGIQIFNRDNAPYEHIGDGEVFEYRYVINTDDPNKSVWLLCFFKRAFFIMLTNSPEKPEEVEVTS